MRKKIVSVICALAVLCSVLCMPIEAAGVDFTPNPQTAYAAQFIQRCDGQRWLINEVERLLNSEQKTLNTVTSAADFAGIKSIGLKDADITGSIPSALGELTELRYLFLSGNHLSGAIPNELFTLSKLENIDLSGNEFSGGIPEGFGTMAALTTLELKGNEFSGTIPDEILNNTTITTLNLMDNRLTGGVPAGLSGMTALEYLNLSKNALGGAIPDLSALTELKALSLWECGLTGSIPDSLYGLTNLQILDLSGNKLEGEVSTALAELMALEYLAVDGNKLRGTLPDAFTAASLKEVHLENNYFRGTVPASLKARNDGGALVYLNNNYMTGTVLKDIENNAGNFTDGASTAQYQLSASKENVQISKNGTVNIYALLQNKALVSGSLAKEILRPDEYEAVFDVSKIEVTSDSNGIYVKALTDIPKTDNFRITVQIKNNDGSNYSKVELALTTDTVSYVGGAGGGVAETPAVQTTTHRLYINGFPDGTFGAGKNITREQTAKMLVDALGKNTESLQTPRFSDVAASRWSYAWVEAAAREGYVQGYEDGSFGPDKAITRAEMATILVRIAAKEGMVIGDTAKTFTDVSDGKWYTEYVKQAVQYGLINGYEDGSFRPEQYITRAEAVVMINRLLKRDYRTSVELKAVSCPFPDVAESYWAYGDIMEASVTHEH